MSGVLAINAGSSGLKFGLFAVDGPQAPLLLARGVMEDAGKVPQLRLEDAAGRTLHEDTFPEGAAMEEILGALLGTLERQLGKAPLVAAGHRVVHGGRVFDGPVRVDEEVLAAIAGLTPLAPLHQPRSLEPLRALMGLRPGLPQVACFDTSFHHGLQPPVSRYAIPRRFEAEGIRKYGFHGLSYGHVAGRLAQISPALAAGRTVVAHLGSGASLCALQNGRSVDTTMGFSALDGLVMGTRCGALDPGIVLHLQQAHGLGVADVEDMLYHQSGLLGVSGISSDMRRLLASPAPQAREAVDLFCFHVSREVAAMANSLQGLDCLVFTGGIGEHAPAIRADIAARLGWIGVACDRGANDGGAERIDAEGSRVPILVIPANEEIEIARQTAALVGAKVPASARLDQDKGQDRT